MPKQPASKLSIVRAYANEFKSFRVDGTTLLCSLCCISVCTDRRSSVLQHLKTAKHQRLEKCDTTTSQQQPLISEAVKGKNEFCVDLAKMCVSADIPLCKLDSPPVREFFSKYLKRDLPTESTIRKNYVPKLYEEKMEEMRVQLAGEYLWIGVDETTDACGRCVTNVFAGALKEDTKPYLIDVQFITSTNNATVGHVLLQALKNLLGEDDDFSKVLLLLTDSAAYMHKMASGLSSLLPNCIHVTCLAHGLHRLAETVRSSFKDVDSLIANTKKVFLKAPRRISLFKEMNPDVPLPPKPIVTRWGTWLEAAIYYADNFDAVRETVDTLDEEDAASINVVKRLFKEDTLKGNLAYIKANFEGLLRTLKKLQDRSLKAPEAWELFCRAVESMNKMDNLRDKATAVLRRNQGLLSLLPILRLISPTCETMGLQLGDVPRLPPAALSSFVHAPLTTVDVERSFSMYKVVLRPNRMRFLGENLRRYMVIHCNR